MSTDPEKELFGASQHKTFQTGSSLTVVRLRVEGDLRVARALADYRMLSHNELKRAVGIQLPAAIDREILDIGSRNRPTSHLSCVFCPILSKSRSLKGNFGVSKV